MYGAHKSATARVVADTTVSDTSMRIDSLSDSTIQKKDSTIIDSIKKRVFIGIDSLTKDSIFRDTIVLDTINLDTTHSDTFVKPFVTEIIKGQSKDSTVYDVKSGNIYMYKDGNVDYLDKKLTADFIQLQLEKELIRAQGSIDTATKKYIRPIFKDGKTEYNMDSIVYNLSSEKAKIYGVEFKEGEGIVRGREIKKSEDGVFNIAGGKFTTCDADHPHFYLAMSKAQYVQADKSKKMIIGPSYVVFEDVPLPLGVPFGFFPMISDRNSGVIIPDIGEENIKGFYLRGGGYYFVFNDYMDLAVRAGIYTMGSWEVSAASVYRKRYKFNGNFNIQYVKDILGSKGSPDYTKMNNYRISWTHQQDPKFHPNSTFSANVNYSTSTYNKYDAQNLNDYVSAQTNSSVSYSKSWAGTPFSLSANLQHSQNNRDSSVMLSLPNFVFSVARFYPFRRREAVGKQRWYEKISLSYTNTFNNSVNTKQNELFSSDMFKKMKYGMKHEIPVTTSFNLLKYFNLSPTANYTERWYFNRINKVWSPEKNQVVSTDTTSGFYRVYDYRVSASLSTRIFGMYEFNGKKPLVKAIRHVMTPSISGSFQPDFGKDKYGYYRAIQVDSTGRMDFYSPYENGIYGVPSRGMNATLSFSLNNSLEMKVRNDADTTGYSKMPLLESFQIASSYNFMADSMKLAPFSITARTTLFKSLGINFNATLDPYALNSKGQRIDRFAVKDGKIGRITNIGLSFGYSFRSVFGYEGKGSGTGSETLPTQPNAEEQDFFSRNQVDYAKQQEILANKYYDFSVPWNLSFNYNLSYSKPGFTAKTTQTLGLNGTLNLTPKWGLSFNGGFDFESKQLTPGSVALTRDLHCWQMSFSWVPIGFRKSWNFNIRVKSGMLRDLKYEKSSGYLDNYPSYY